MITIKLLNDNKLIKDVMIEYKILLLKFILILIRNFSIYPNIFFIFFIYFFICIFLIMELIKFLHLNNI
jgi:hypothetical protein